MNALKNASLILIGSVFYSVGIGLFLSPNQLASGGITGLAIIVSHFWKLGTGTVTFILNIPLALLGIWKFGRKFLYSTIFAVVITSVLINILEPFGAVTQDLLLASLTGGALVSIGIGIIFKAGATTGGSDILIKLLRLKFKHLKTGTIFLITDAIVIAISAFAFKNINSALYAILCIVIQSFVLDIILYGTDSAKLIYIISDKDSEIVSILLEKLSVGATYINASGTFSQQNKKIIMCAVRKQLLPKIRESVKQTDSHAFMIVTSANEIFGEGFKEYDSPEL